MTTTPIFPNPEPAVAIRGRIRDLNPGWFASVMGTGILAITTYNNPGGLASIAGAARALGITLAMIAYLLGAVLLVVYAVRWVAHTGAAMADFRHPVKGAMHATLPGGLLVLALMTSVVSPSLFAPATATLIIAILAAVGVVVALVMGVAFAMILITGEPPAASVNGGWFIPPVVTIIIPMVLAPLAAQADPGTAGLLVALSYAFYGMGFVLFLLTLGLVYDRLILHPLPPAPLAPTVWIGLGPIAVAALAPIAVAKAGASLWGDLANTVSLITRLASTAVWGFGLWWLALAVALLVRYLRKGGVPFHLGWWAFVFPLGAYTAATTTLARAWQSPVLEGLGVLAYLGLLTAWVTVVVRTVAGIRSGRIWAS